MKFTGCEPLKSLEPIIELSYGAKEWDLHNIGEFQGFSYNNKEKIVIMDWKYFDEEGNPLKKLFRLEFGHVKAFEVKRRDPEMPYSEDDCLSEIIFNDVEDSFVVRFMGGQEIKIYCGELKCLNE
ncbi:MAG: hypothetical protein M0Z70_11465 [Nitrospiraceae bacterium]|nr:hypothetical protein [Nitrospirota bacterium]MDA8339905.1 hypothetical protein [Nitrospiraceae bacterium]